MFVYQVGDFIDNNYKIIEINYKIKNNREIPCYKIQCIKCGRIRNIRCDVISTEFKKYNNQLAPCRDCLKLKPFKKGDIVNGFEILTDYYTKSDKQGIMYRYYKVKCLKCGNIEEKTESAIRNKKQCNVCCGREIKIGVNDIATLYPDFTEWFWDENDAVGRGIASKDKVYFKCPTCGEKCGPYQIRIVYNTGHFICMNCSDTVSYPERFFFAFTKQFNYKVYCHKSFDWSNGREYDFYFPELNLIVETHGIQHYEEVDSFKLSLEEQRQIDQEKENMAKNNSIINYVQLDCRRGENLFIQRNILNNDVLCNIFEKDTLVNLNWNSIYNRALKNTQNTIIEMWNNDERDIGKISEEVPLEKDSIVKYLVKFTKDKLLNFPYIPRNYSLEKKNKIFEEYGINYEIWQKEMFTEENKQMFSESVTNKLNNYWGNKDTFRKKLYEKWNSGEERNIGKLSKIFNKDNSTICKELRQGMKLNKLTFPYIQKRLTEEQENEIFKKFSLNKEKYNDILNKYY